MKIDVRYEEGRNETEITIKCSIQPDKETRKIIQELKTFHSDFEGYKDGAIYRLPLTDVYYFDCTDSRVFCYMEKEVYETTRKLYEWEEHLVDTPFVRISKSTILNTAKLESVRPMLSGRMEGVLVNGEKQMINRHYLAGFRRKFGI